MSLTKIFGWIVPVLALFFVAPAFAQTINKSTISNMRVDDLTDDQVKQFITLAEARGYDPLDEVQLQQAANEAGMKVSSTEIKKLIARIEVLKRDGSIKSNTPSNQGRQPSSGRRVIGMDSVGVQQDSLTAQQREKEAFRKRIFGSEIFTSNKLTFEPNLRLATPRNYVVGTDDEIQIDIYGYSEANYNLQVSPEGTINIPYVGVVKVSGITIEAATSRIKSRLSTIYSGIRTGNTNVSVNVGNIRSIKVILTGEVVKPGTYTFPSLATVFHALYSSGGPTENGSFREIDLIRAGKKIATIDVYGFLLTGQLKNDIRLQDQDVIRFPAYKNRVEVEGEVKHPGIFEMLPGESLNDLLSFTSGFTESAYRARVKVLKNTATERKLADITESQFATYKPEAGDKFFVSRILNRYANRVKVEGAVFRAGDYELTPGLTVKQLILQAEGVREDAFRNRASITRLKDDNQIELIDFDLGMVLAGTAADIPLKREDVVTISSIFDLKEEYLVTIDGEVRNPRTIAYAEGMTVEDLIIKAGGLKEGATPNRIEVARRVSNSNVLSVSAKTADIYNHTISLDLKAQGTKFVLQPFDIVTVRASAGYEKQQQVRVTGEVLYTGLYTISKKDERISDFIQRAGGLTAIAYVEGASLRRPGPNKPQQDSTDTIDPVNDSKQRIKQFERLQKRVNNAATLDLPAEDINNFVGINLAKIMKQPGSKEDIFLEDGDILNVPKQLQTVTVNGEVLSPNTVIFAKSKGFRDYISNAGGFTQKAKKRHSFIRYANGSVKSTSKIFFFTNYPAVKPGAVIFVPQKEERKAVSVAELVGITSGIASLGAIVLGIMNLSK
ncbi:SLBB domain-containing protein [Hufsiella ginkgonis]|uniref:Capsule biosynthesis protein n=1 Tax=Hufsiella ginkgonis TaxID=2695274 RepID=A0A7K1Y2D7_9SPHI|nr:SLBB domain-containing protein [Hufsiella ginkgonis]MXV17372.1 capsule biosynthesis protein [Hufsiella ginkgonis]